MRDLWAGSFEGLSSVRRRSAVAMVACLGPIGVAGAGAACRGCSRMLMAAAAIAGLTVAAWAPAATAAGVWRGPVTLSAAGDALLGSPQVAMDRAGNATAVWPALGRRSPYTHVAAAATRPAGGSFSRPVNLSTGPADYADVAMNPAGDTVAIWLGIGLGLQAAIRPVGGGFSPPTDLAVGDEGESIALAIDQAGGAIVVFGGEFSDHGVQAVLRSAGGGFSKPVNLSRQGALSPQVAIDQAGDAIVVWHREIGKYSVVQAAMRPAGGSFSKPVNLSARRQNAGGAQVAINQAGDAIVVWDRETGKHSGVVQAVLRPAGGRFSKPVNLSTQRQNAYGAQVAIDQAGNAIVVWARSTGKRGRVQAVLRPAGRSFSKAVNLSRVSKRKDVLPPLPEVAINPSGDAVVGWVRTITKSGIWRVQAAMRPAGGDFSKPVNLSTPFRGKGAFTATPDVAISPSGSAIVVWDRDIGKRSIAQAATYDATARGQPTALRSPRDALALWAGS